MNKPYHYLLLIARKDYFRFVCVCLLLFFKEGFNTYRKPKSCSSLILAPPHIRTPLPLPSEPWGVASLSLQPLAEEGGKAAGENDTNNRGGTSPRRATLSALQPPAEPRDRRGGGERRQRALLAATATWRRRGTALPAKRRRGRRGCLGPGQGTLRGLCC